MAIKDFKNESNNILWNWYHEHRFNIAKDKNMKLGKDEEKSTTDAKISVAQYKQHMRILEEETQKDFELITLAELQNVSVKSKSFVNGFYIDCVVNGKMKPNSDVIINLIPEEYRKLVQVIMQ